MIKYLYTYFDISARFSTNNTNLTSFTHLTVIVVRRQRYKNISGGGTGFVTLQLYRLMGKLVSTSVGDCLNLTQEGGRGLGSFCSLNYYGFEIMTLKVS